MSAVVIEIQPYIDRKAQKKLEEYSPAQFMEEVTFHWLEFLLAMIETGKDHKAHD